MQDTKKPDASAMLVSITSRLDEVIEKITKSKKYVSARILSEVKADILSSGGQFSSDAHAAATLNANSPVVVIPAPVKKPKPEGVTEYVAQNGEIDDALIALSIGKHLSFTGATGCGKTTLAHWLAHLRGQQIITISGTEGVTTEQIIGYPTIENGNRSYVEGLLPIAMQKGFLFYMDEPNMIADSILSVCFSAMDDRREITLTDDGGRVVKAHPDFRVISAMNEGYSGTHSLNQAFRRRSMIIDLEYLPAAKEKRLLCDRTACDKDIADKLVNAATQLRASRSRGDIRTDVGTASLLAAAELMVNKMSVKAALDMAIVNLVPSTLAPEKKAVSDVIAAFFPEYNKATARGGK